MSEAVRADRQWQLWAMGAHEYSVSCGQWGHMGTVAAVGSVWGSENRQAVAAVGSGGT